MVTKRERPPVDDADLNDWASYEEGDEQDERDEEFLDRLDEEDRRLFSRLVVKLVRSDDATFESSKLAGRFVGVLCQGLRAMKGGLFTKVKDEVVLLAARRLRLATDEEVSPAEAGLEEFSATSIREAFKAGKVVVSDLPGADLGISLPESVRLNMPGPRVHVPILAPPSAADAGKPFAVLALARAEGQPSFSEKVPLLEELATLMAPMLHRSQLYQDTQEALTMYGDKLKEAEERAQALQLELSASAKKAFHEIVYRSEAMKKALDRAKYAAASKSLPVLIMGSSGVGKGLVARGIHALSPRKSKPFFSRNCGINIEPTQLYADLFGAARGSYTGSIEERVGYFQLADGGTIFLDEIGNAGPQVQEMLLQVLEEGIIVRLGDPRQQIKVNVRVIAATNANLPVAIETGRFRSDLYYRLRGVVVEIPELRERRADIPLLAEHFLQKFMAEEEVERMSFTVDALNVLLRAPWVGNVRELRNVVYSAMLFAKGGVKIREEHVRMALDQGREFEGGEAPAERGRVTRERLLRALEESGWSGTATARALGISRTHVYYLKDRFGITDPPKTDRRRGPRQR